MKVSTGDDVTKSIHNNKSRTAIRYLLMIQGRSLLRFKINCLHYEVSIEGMIVRSLWVLTNIGVEGQNMTKGILEGKCNQGSHRHRL